MNESTFLAEFYGPTLTWFRPIFGCMGLLAVLGNGLLIWTTFSTPSIRSVNSNWFIVSMAMLDFLYGLTSSVLSEIAFTCGKNGSCPVLVRVCGGLFISIVESAIVYPTFIVVNRYLTVTRLPSDNSRLRSYLNSDRGILMIIFFIWIIVIVTLSIFVSFDVLGEDFLGFYGAKPFTSFWLYLVYMIAGAYGISSYFVTFYFYGKLQKFVDDNMERSRENRSTSQKQRKEHNETKAVLKMVKLSTLIPLITQSGGFAINGGQWFIPHDLIPMWCRRIIIIAFSVSPICSPFVSMLILGPFKRELKRCFGRIIRANSVGTTVEITGNQAVVSIA